ncbi:unnamed protein product [Schistosoma spindalis]|nr:unnamed protein product [Schistosoma spindale]
MVDRGGASGSPVMHSRSRADRPRKRHRNSSSASSRTSSPGSFLVSEIKRNGRNEEIRRRDEQRAEEDRILRQRWAESKLLEEEVARRLERYLDSELAKLLVLRRVQFNAEIERRVEAERTEVLRRRAEEAERKAREEAEALQRREEEEKRLKELNERLAQERERELEEQRRLEEEAERKRCEAELRELEERQRREAEELQRIKREQEIILNKKRIRPKLSFTLKK